MQEYIKQTHKDQCIEAIKRVVSFPSVLKEDENGTPFGQAIQDVLEDTLNLCQSLGFSTYIDPKGYYGYAQVGEGEELLAILCHLDVVPAGDLKKWDTPPFEAQVIGDYIHGRGTQDDKGPTMAALFAVKALMDAGVTFDKRIRFIFGTDEETLWRCMNRYNEIEEKATMGFAPDSAFPLTYAEKGLLQIKLHGAPSDVLELEVGEAFNVVPGKATYSGKLIPELALQLDGLGFDYELKEDSITVIGSSKHSKDALDGVNAIIRLAYGLSELVEHPVLNFLVDEIGEDATGGTIFGAIQDGPSGSLTMNVAGVTISSNASEIRIDMRIPVLADMDRLLEELIEKAKEYGLTYEEFDYLAPLYVPLDSYLVNTLMSVYQEKTGDMSPAVSSGGATFARTMDNCVAYGAVFQDSPMTEHMENERMALKDIFGAMDIYAEAIARLAGQK